MMNVRQAELMMKSIGSNTGPFVAQLVIQQRFGGSRSRAIDVVTSEL
jgi:hypothetical protein